MIKYCKCGCGQEVKPSNTYINHHNRKGVVLSTGTKKKIRKANLGKTLSDETKKKISLKSKGRPSWNTGLVTPKEVRDKISRSMRGKIKTKEHVRKVGLAVKRYHENASSEEKEKIRKRCSHVVSEESRKLFVLRGKERFANKEERDKISRSVKKLWGDSEYRKKQINSQPLKKEKQSISAVERIKKYPRTAGGYGKSGYFYSKKNKKDLHYRSSYELVAYELLEQMSVVKKYEVEVFAIPYYYNGIKHRTIPDIIVTYMDGKQEFVEVKAAWKIDNDIEIAKFDAMKKYAMKNNMNFNIWTEKELGL